MRKLIFTFLSATMLFCAPALPLHAALVGTSVAGSLQFGTATANYFDPVFGFVPGGYLNSAGTTVTISGSAVEFGFDDSGNLFTANFTDNQLIISDSVRTSNTNSPFTMIFTDSAFTGLNIATVSDSFPLTYSLNGNVLTIQGARIAVTAGQTLAATLSIAPTPEPSTVGLLLFSGLAVVVFARARRTADRPTFSNKAGENSRAA